MPRSSLLTRMTVLLTGAVLTMLTAQVHANSEEYYSTNLDDAVESAKHNPTNTTYVGARWYNRSTSKSFSLPPMMNTEMGQEVVEGAMGPTAAGEAAIVESQQPVRDSAMGRGSKSKNLDDTNADTKGQAASEEERAVEKPTDFSFREARSPTSVARDVYGSGITVKAALTQP